MTYRVTLVVVDLGWVDLYFDVPMSARFCWGQWGFGRTGWAAGQDDGTSESKSTQPRSATTSVTLYRKGSNVRLTGGEQSTALAKSEH